MDIIFNGETWPFTGRKAPAGATLAVRYPYNTDRYKSKWKDLCWYNAARDVWTYLSTLPA